MACGMWQAAAHLYALCGMFIADVPCNFVACHSCDMTATELAMLCCCSILAVLPNKQRSHMCRCVSACHLHLKVRYIVFYVTVEFCH